MTATRNHGPTVGGLFFGYGGLDLAVAAAFDADLIWYSEVDKGANAIAAHRYPNIPNHGDITTIDWSTVEPVDILTGGSPCQDLSHAGKRGGMTEGTRSNLWVAMREGIAQLRPATVVWENVRGALSARADSDMEPDEGLLGPRGGGPALRALGRVLGDLADLGYDARWHSIRASDVGAPHNRFRVFVVAEDAHQSVSREWRVAAPGQAEGGRAWADAGRRGRDLLPTPRVGGQGVNDSERRRNSPNLETVVADSLLPTPRATGGTKGGPNQRVSSGDLMLPSAVAMLPTPTARDWKNVGDPEKTAARMAERGQPLGEVVVNALLPTPAVNDMGEGKTPDAWDEWTDEMRARHGNGNGHGKSLAIKAQRLLPTPVTEPTTGNGHARNLGAEARLLPTPTSMDSDASGGGYNGQTNVTLTDATARQPDRWGDYAAAIARWEETLGRPAPEPTMTSARGNPQLSPAFVEWMMGLPAGWVTDTPDLTRNQALKALGNGVVPQQAYAAIVTMLGWPDPLD